MTSRLLAPYVIIQQTRRTTLQIDVARFDCLNSACMTSRLESCVWNSGQGINGVNQPIPNFLQVLLNKFFHWWRAKVLTTLLASHCSFHTSWPQTVWNTLVGAPPRLNRFSLMKIIGWVSCGLRWFPTFLKPFHVAVQHPWECLAWGGLAAYVWFCFWSRLDSLDKSFQGQECVWQDQSNCQCHSMLYLLLHQVSLFVFK